jgi:DNA-binding NarL/FixJ family response regulator
MPRPTVLLADDHALVAEGVASLLAGEFTLAGIVADGAQLLETAERLSPDVIVTDLAMPGMSGLEVLRRLKSRGVPARVIILTMHADAQLAADAFRAGAAGFVVKHAAGEQLIAAIHAVVRGGTYLTPHLSQEVVARLAEPRASAGRLTPRQIEVMRLTAEGLTMKEVARALGVSPRTVESHKYELMQVLGLATTADLIRYAVEHGLTTPPPPA